MIEKKGNQELVNENMAIITGIQGQDGSYLAELLLKKGYIVIGIARRKGISMRESNYRIRHILDKKNTKLILETGDITDAGFISKLLLKYKPSEYYNLAAMSFVKESWNTPITTMEINAIAVNHALESIRVLSPKTRFLQASSSEMFGNNPNPPFNEKSIFYPRSPYAFAKISAHHMVKVYRESYNIFACASICFNHESPRRGEEFVTQKIAKGVAMIKKGLQKKIILGNLDAERDWGYSADYVQGMWLMMQAPEPKDYVLSMGTSHSIKDFVRLAFASVGITNWQDYIGTDKKFMRPAEVNKLYGDSTKIREELGWCPTTTFTNLVKLMVEAQMARLTPTI